MDELTCERVGELSAAYALDALDDQEGQAVAAHVRGCRRSVHSEVAAGLRLREALLGAVAPVEPSAALRERLMASAAATAQEPELQPRGGSRTVAPAPSGSVAASGVARPWMRWRWAVAIAATSVAVVVVLGLSGLDLRNRIAEQDIVLGRVTAALAAGGNVARVETAYAQGYLLRTDGEVTLVATNVPASAVGSHYAMWLIPPDGRPQRAGTFTSDGHGLVVTTASGAARDGQTFAVTIEEAVVDQPTGKPIIAVPVPTGR